MFHLLENLATGWPHSLSKLPSINYIVIIRLQLNISPLLALIHLRKQGFSRRGPPYVQPSCSKQPRTVHPKTRCSSWTNTISVNFKTIVIRFPPLLHDCICISFLFARKLIFYQFIRSPWLVLLFSMSTMTIFLVSPDAPQNWNRNAGCLERPSPM
jgi:hypothetical protein